MSNADAPAMPTLEYDYEDREYLPEHLGLTKREYFAAMAMKGLVAHYGAEGAHEGASLAIEYADALLKELEK